MGLSAEEHENLAAAAPRAERTAPVTNVRNTPLSTTDPEQIAAAEALLASIPIDVLPQRDALPAGSRMPLAPNPLFVGRGGELLQVAAALKGGGTVALGQVVASTGLGGLGKTQLAVEFVHRYGRYFTGGVFWLSFASADEVPMQVAGCVAPAFESRSLDERVRLMKDAWRSAIPRLLVFDNCDEEQLLDAWRPPSGGCRILVTSRRSYWTPTLGVTALSLDVLPRVDGIELLRRYRPDLEPDNPGLDALAEELGDLPLALHLAGSYLRAYRAELSLDGYLAELRRSDVVQHASLLGAGLDDSPSPTHHVQSVAQTFALSLARLDCERDVDRVAIALLARMACMAPGEPVPRELLAKTLEEVDPIRRADGLRRLGAAGLVEESEGWLRLHRLVVHFVRQAGLDPQAKTAVDRALIRCGHDAADRHLSGAVLSAVVPHIVEVARSASAHLDDYGEPAAELCMAAGTVLLYAVDLDGAQPWFERALVIRERVFGPDHPDTATSLNWLALLLRDLDALAARSLLERALAIRERALGSHHTSVAHSLTSLANLLRDQGELDNARPLLERALAIDESVHGPSHYAIVRDLCSLSVLLYALGDLAAAKSLAERAVTICERTLGPNHADTAWSLSSLATVLHAQGELASARSLFERALAIREGVQGPDHPDTAQTLWSFASLLCAQGELSVAATLVERGVIILNRTMGPDYIGKLLHAQSELVGALPLVERAVVLWEQALGLDQSAFTDGSSNGWADSGLVTVRPLHERVVSVLRLVLGSDHPITIAIRGSLANLEGSARLPVRRSEVMARLLDQVQDHFGADQQAL
jgi:tetratricopeptide (TPR) repeat protein